MKCKFPCFTLLDFQEHKTFFLYLRPFSLVTIDDKAVVGNVDGTGASSCCLLSFHLGAAKHLADITEHFFVCLFRSVGSKICVPDFYQVLLGSGVLFDGWGSGLRKVAEYRA